MKKKKLISSQLLFQKEFSFQFKTQQKIKLAENVISPMSYFVTLENVCVDLDNSGVAPEKIGFVH